MKNSDALAIDYEDIVFFGKNKDYGAYTLRRSYRKHLSLAILTAVTIFTGAVSSPLWMKSSKPISKSGGYTSPTVIILDPPDEKIKHDPVFEPPVNIRSSIKFLIPKPVPDENPTTENVPTQEDMQKIAIGTKNLTGNDTSPDLNTIEIPVEKETPAETKEKEFTWVEEMPNYKGDESEIYKFFASNIKYPEIAKRAVVEGRVTLQFIVAKDGSITNITVLKGIGAGCDEEAVRVLSLMGKWSPGRQNGNPVRVVMSIPILFKLQSGSL